MNRVLTTLYRDFACGAAAALITLVLGMSFVVSTSVLPGSHIEGISFSAVQPHDAWFGQPEPAVLVD
jgi:hypothetical protein